MKKIFSAIMILILCISMASCGAKKVPVSADDIINPVNVSISISDSSKDQLTGDGVKSVEKTEFIVEEGTNVLDATQLFCIANDIDFTVGPSGDYISSLNGLKEKDLEDTTGWIFLLNGEMGNKSAKDEVLEEGDEISWEFVDFTTFS